MAWHSAMPNTGGFAVSEFSWLGQRREPPPHWDLRKQGWTLAAQPPGEVCLVDMRFGRSGGRSVLHGRDCDPARCLYLGVTSGPERARLLEAGAGDALATATLAEIAARARRIAEGRDRLPRYRAAGPLTLDLLHRDARLAERWLTLHPREFGLLWRLAEHPGECVSRACLLREVWRIEFEPGTNTVEVHVSRLRAKLAAAGLRELIETAPGGGYRVALGPTRANPPSGDQRLCA